MNTEIFLPTLPHWQFGNNWSGSAGRLRFFITASGGEEGLAAELWTQDVCRELAQVEETRSFPCTQEGLDELRAWLTQRAEALG